jgi:hypothetical protein
MAHVQVSQVDAKLALANMENWNCVYADRSSRDKRLLIKPFL